VPTFINSGRRARDADNELRALQANLAKAWARVVISSKPVSGANSGLTSELPTIREVIGSVNTSAFTNLG
jgi:hypothetical protein